MNEVKIYGDLQTTNFYGGGSYCLLAKIKKVVGNAKNSLKITFRLFQQESTFVKNDYYIYYDGNSNSISFVNLEKITSVKCYMSQDDNYLYVYANNRTTGYPIIMQILNCSEFSLTHIELMHLQDFTATMIGTSISPTFYYKPTTLTDYTLSNNWVDNGYTYIRTQEDKVKINLMIQNGTISDYTTIVSGLPSRDASEPDYLYYTAIYKDASGIMQSCYVYIDKSGNLKIMKVANNALLLCNFEYKKIVNW